MRVVLRRQGIVGPADDLGIATALASGEAVLRAIGQWRRPLGRARSRRRAALVDPAALAALPPLEARRLSAPSRYAVAASRLALGGATVGDGARTAVVLGAGYGPSAYSERLLSQIFEESPEAASPMLFAESVANAPAAQVALKLGFRGPNITVTQRQSSALAAVQQGAREILLGRCDDALVGGVEELTPLVFDILERFGSLDPENRARPFDRRRGGVLAAEGSVIWWLSGVHDERDSLEDSALGYVDAWARAFDSTAPAFGFGRQPERIAVVLGDQLATHAWSPGDVDLVVSGATGGRASDAYEGRLLKSYFGDRLPPVVAPSAVLGELPCAVLAGAVHAISGGEFGAPWFDEVDPALGIEPHRGPIPAMRRILLTSASTGGALYWLGIEAAQA